VARAGLTTAAVVAAGLELADAEGMAAVTMSALARRLGVQVPSLYAHLGGAGDLGSRMTAAALDELADLAQEAVAGRARGEALTAMAQTYRAYAAAHPGRWRATRAEPRPTEEVLAAGRRHSDLARAVLRGYGLAEPDATHAVRLVGSVVTGWVESEQTGAFAHSPPEAEESWGWTLGLLDRALAGG